MKKFLLTIVTMLFSFTSQAQSKDIKLNFYKDGKVTYTQLIAIPFLVPAPKTVVITKIVKQKAKPRKAPKPQIIKEIEYKIVPIHLSPTALDTIAILQKYYPRNIYTDVIKFHNNAGEVTIIDTIAHNRLVGRSWQATIRHNPEVLQLADFSTRKTSWYMGPYVSTNFTQAFQSFGFSIIRQGPSNTMLQLNVGNNVHEGKIKSNAFFGLGVLLKLN